MRGFTKNMLGKLSGQGIRDCNIILSKKRGFKTPPCLFFASMSSWSASNQWGNSPFGTRNFSFFCVSIVLLTRTLNKLNSLSLKLSQNFFLSFSDVQPQLPGRTSGNVCLYSVPSLYYPEPHPLPCQNTTRGYCTTEALWNTRACVMSDHSTFAFSCSCQHKGRTWAPPRKDSDISVFTLFCSLAIICWIELRLPKHAWISIRLPCKSCPESKVIGADSHSGIIVIWALLWDLPANNLTPS